MKFSVNQVSLSKALSYVTRALPLKSEKTLLENISLVANEDGLILTASDGNLTITSSTPAMVEDGGTTLVPGKLFNDMVRKMPGMEMICALNSRLIMNIRCGSMKANLTCSGMDYPEGADLSSLPELCLPKAMLSYMISKVAFAVSVQDSRPLLMGINMEITENELRMVALDGFRVALQVKKTDVVMPKDTPQISAVVPGKVMTVLRDIMETSDAKEVWMRIGKEKIWVKIGETEIQAPLLVGSFMNYRNVLPKNFLTKIKVDRQELQRAVDRAALIAQEGKNNLIKLSSKNDVLQITSNSEMGDDLEEIPALIDGEEITIAFNSRYLTDILRNMEEDTVMLNMNTNVSPCVICNENEEDESLYLLLPVRTY